ncbi:MAG: AAA family ATPase [Verrucomicrobiota bacterium JB022]|nr:AAA family ATPase [Verrucomicrobiota bacterium JB022]
MHLERLTIKDWRNLRDFEIDFTRTLLDDSGKPECESDGQPIELKSYAVIGQNGSGKSNLIEAIVTIFRDLDLKEKTGFDYELTYRVRGHRVEIKATGDKREAWITDKDSDQCKKRALSFLSNNARTYLPSHVFAYYSGRSNRIEALFQRHQQRFYKALTDGDDELLRRLFYCRTVHSQFVLLAYLLNEGKGGSEEASQTAAILDKLGIDDLDSVLFVLKRPYWNRNDDLSEQRLIEGDPRFWYSVGVVQEFLDKLWKVAIAPIDHTDKNRTIDFRGRTEDQDLLYMFVPDKEALQKLASEVGEPSRFFKYLESTYISDLIDEVRINVKHRDVEGNITFGQLSEGEQQLLTVLGLMRFTKEDQSLFLLDEPDTHLNPLWKFRFFDEIEETVSLQKDTLMGDSQLLVTTHDPIMIGSLRKEQVRILRKTPQGRIEVREPDIDPRGMGFAGLLKSELFGLRSTVDSETLKRLDRRNYLFAKGNERTHEENEEMARLSDELAELGFAKDFKDPYYAKFVEKMALHTKFHKSVLTPEEQAEQDRVADEIISQILAEEEAQ